MTRTTPINDQNIDRIIDRTIDPTAVRSTVRTIAIATAGRVVPATERRLRGADAGRALATRAPVIPVIPVIPVTPAMRVRVIGLPVEVRPRVREGREESERTAAPALRVRTVRGTRHGTAASRA